MSSVYAMKRANGDWFAFEDHGRHRVPLFSNSHEAMRARERNWGMMLFKPVMFDERALSELALTDDDSGSYYWLADGSSTKLSHGHSISHERLASLIRDPAEQLPE